MAAYYVSLLRRQVPEGPYYLGGWCYGGIVALEMAQQLIAAGQRIGFLGLLETVAPPPSLRVLRYYRHRFKCFLRLGPAQWGSYFRQKVAYLRDVRLANRMRFRRLEERSDQDAGAIEEQNRRLAQLEHVYTMNLRALKSYRPRPYPGKVTLFNAEKIDKGVIPDPLCAWVGLADEIETHTVPGDHDSMLTEPNVAVLAQKLDAALRRAQEAQQTRTPRGPTPLQRKPEATLALT
jgi:thioesterase domain-containing protein